MAIGTTGIFDPKDFKNLVGEMAELNEKVEKQTKQQTVADHFDRRRGNKLFGVSSKSLKEFTEAKKGIKNQRDALEKLREEFGDSVTGNKQYQKIQERLKKDEIKQNRLLMEPAGARKERAKEALNSSKEMFAKHLGRNSFFGKTMGGVIGIFKSIGGFLTKTTASIGAILGAGLTVAALFGIANFLESETFKKMIPNIKASIGRIVDAFSEGGILAGLKQVGAELKRVFDWAVGETSIKEKLKKFTKNWTIFGEDIENVGRDTLFAAGVGGTFEITRRLKNAVLGFVQRLGYLTDDVDKIVPGAAKPTQAQALAAMASNKGAMKSLKAQGITQGAGGGFFEEVAGKGGKTTLRALKPDDARLMAASEKFLTSGGSRFAKLMKGVFKIAPVASAAYMGYELWNLLNSDASDEEKIVHGGGLIFGTIGAMGLSALGGFIGSFGGPLGILGGILTGAVLGGFAGDVGGRMLMRFLLGEDVDSIDKNPNPRGNMLNPYIPAPPTTPEGIAQVQQDLERSQMGGRRWMALQQKRKRENGAEGAVVINADKSEAIINNGMTLVANSAHPIDPQFRSLTLLSQPL